jgi:hypothetical protein
MSMKLHLTVHDFYSIVNTKDKLNATPKERRSVVAITRVVFRTTQFL